MISNFRMGMQCLTTIADKTLYPTNGELVQKPIPNIATIILTLYSIVCSVDP